MNNLELTLKSIVSEAVKEALSDMQSLSVKTEPKSVVNKMMSLDELREYLPDHPARQTIYGWVNNRLVPFEKHGRRLLFKKSKIDEWLNNGRIVSHLKEED